MVRWDYFICGLIFQSQNDKIKLIHEDTILTGELKVWNYQYVMWTHTIPNDQFRCITLACTLARRLKYSSGTRIQHDLAWLNKLILVSERELNNLTHGYKLQISKTVSLFKWIGSSLLYAITCSFQPKLKQSTFCT
jgi:hypothetical protein